VSKPTGGDNTVRRRVTKRPARRPRRRYPTRHATLALVSNGIGAVARAKVARLELDRYFAAIVISGEVGTAKPDAGIFDIVFDQLGNPDKATALMIGDSLTSDIAGGINYGIDTCWYAPVAPETASSEATSRVGTFEEIPSVFARI
jgi:HAD superfamily hydrolase (TIGR01509 family)